MAMNKEMTMEEKKELGVIFHLTPEEIRCIDAHLDVTKFMITDVDVEEFCKEYGFKTKPVNQYLFAITHPNFICARCVNNNFVEDDYPCRICSRNPSYKDYFSDGSNNK